MLETKAGKKTNLDLSDYLIRLEFGFDRLCSKQDEVLDKGGEMSVVFVLKILKE